MAKKTFTSKKFEEFIGFLGHQEWNFILTRSKLNLQKMIFCEVLIVSDLMSFKILKSALNL